MANKKKRSAAGGGTLRKRSDGRWEARYTVGFDPATGRQIQKSVYGSTQKEARQKLSQIVAELDAGTYHEPCKMTLGEWLDIWLADYQNGVKESTAFLYRRQVDLYLRPALGRIRLEQLDAHTIQHLYNQLRKDDGKAPLSPKSIKNIHGVLHRALQQAVRLNYIRFNPASACILPRSVKKEIRPMSDQQTAQFLMLLQGNKYELPLKVDLFTGLREGELLGLKWECVDFDQGTIRVVRQLCRERQKGGKYYFSAPKNDKSRTLMPAPYVMNLLRTQRARQAQQRLLAGAAWQDSGLVFTNEFGRYLSYRALYDSFKQIARQMGLPELRIHDLRHTYAVNSIRAGDDIKTVQSNLGHATAAFTLDVYGHFTDDMRMESSQRMEKFIAGILLQ